MLMRELKIALIGGGFMGKAHSLAYALAPLAEDIGARLSRELLIDVSPAVAARQAAALGWKRHGTDWREAVASDDIDIVDICTPPPLHEEIALAAIAAGKHVFCEKPITNDSAAAHRMAQAARESGLVAQVGFNYRHSPAVAYTKKLLEEGRLGTPLQFRASYLQEVAFWADPERWRANRHTGGSGMVGDIGSHIIDAAEYLFGDIVRVAARVRAMRPGSFEGWAPEDERRARGLLDEAGVWVAEFANGAIGSFTVNAYASGRKNRFYFALDASRGAVEFTWNAREEFRVSYRDEEPDHRGFRTIHTGKEHPNGWWPIAGLGTGYVDVSAIQFQKFIRSIVHGDPVSPTFDDAAHVQDVVEAVVAAAESNSWVEVPPRQGR